MYMFQLIKRLIKLTFPNTNNNLSNTFLQELVYV